MASTLWPSCDAYHTFDLEYVPQGPSPFRYQHILQPVRSYHPYKPRSRALRHQHSSRPRGMAVSNPNEMDDFQRLSDDYRAELPGPLIGEKLPMSVLTTEYAQADPTYVVKTTALAQNYSSYRTIKGDGQCGWRGTVFGYFEMLLQLGDIDIVQQERVRLQSFEDTMRMAGIDYDIIIDMFDYTWELFDDVEKAVHRQDKSDAAILNSLNDEVKSDSIVYHFKMMTSAFMQLRADQYEPFLEIPIADYRVSRIDPSNQEIDQVGLQALTDAVIAPAQFALEVLYLDRSMGEEVTPHEFVADSMGKPTIRLLYRPGHYDIIYKDGHHSIQLFFTKDNMIPQNMDMAAGSEMSSDLQAYLFTGPEMAQAQAQAQSQQASYMGSGNGSSGLSDHHYIYPPHSQLTCIQQPLQYNLSPTAPMPVLNLDYPATFPISYPSPCSSTMSSSSHPTSPKLSSSKALPPAKKSKDELQFRLNINCFKYQLKKETMPLYNQTYGSSAALSPAHFRNQEFQPQMWRAEEEYLRS